MISILIPAYKTKDYIEECLDSIASQVYLNSVEYEIIVGVDACQETFDKVMDIRHKYNNLVVVMMNDHSGLFITLNTLLSIAKYDNIIKFDSDDIMLPTLIQDIMSVDADLVRFKFLMYYRKDDIRKFHINTYANGVYRVKKHVFNVFGGYQPWQCAADTEFLYRFNQYGKYKYVLINKELFYYRQHNETLTRKIPMSLRLEYHKQFKDKIYHDFMVFPVTGKYRIV